MLEIADDGTGGADDAGDGLRVYVQHTNGERPHRALDLKPPTRGFSTTATVSTPHALQMNRRDLLGGLIHEYELAAA